MLFTIEEYKEALLYDDSFKTLKIKPVTDSQGEFIFSSGRTAVVFKVRDTQNGSFKALKCFTHIHEEAVARNHVISRFLRFVKSPYLVSHDFLENEIWIESAYQPVVLMDWVEGDTLHYTLNRLCRQAKNKDILNLALQFDQMALWLLGQPFAHGDLKADNLILNPQQQLIAVDYEGFFVPALQGMKALELGTEDYQHPERRTVFFNKNIDDVSILIISAALHALTYKSELWTKYNKGENLLFMKRDLEQPGQSELWNDFFNIESESVRNRLNLLQYTLLQGKISVMGLKEVLQLSHNQTREMKKILQTPFINPGVLNTSFNISLKSIPDFKGLIQSIKQLPDGKFLICGDFIKGIARFKSNGELDVDFWDAIGDGFQAEYILNVSDITIQDDGKILVGGHFNSFNGKKCNNIARIFTDGKFDSSFQIGIGFNNEVDKIQLQNDGKILVSGSFTSYNNNNCWTIARLLSDGELDVKFNSNLENTFYNKFYWTEDEDNSDYWIFNHSLEYFYLNNKYSTFHLLPNGKILLFGYLEGCEGYDFSRFALISDDGFPVISFTDSVNDLIIAINIQSDQKIIVGGRFTRIEGKVHCRIARLFPDGTPDSSFHTGEGFNGLINSIQVQSDGKILVGGSFSSYNGTACYNIARLNSDGTLDEDFITGNGFDAEVNTLVILPDNKLMVGGKFTSYDGIFCSKIAQIYL